MSCTTTGANSESTDMTTLSERVSKSDATPSSTATPICRCTIFRQISLFILHQLCMRIDACLMNGMKMRCHYTVIYAYSLRMCTVVSCVSCSCASLCDLPGMALSATTMCLQQRRSIRYNNKFLPMKPHPPRMHTRGRAGRSFCVWC